MNAYAQGTKSDLARNWSIFFGCLALVLLGVFLYDPPPSDLKTRCTLTYKANPQSAHPEKSEYVCPDGKRYQI